MSNIYIFGGGTFSSIRNHLALAAPAFGTTARRLKQYLLQAELVLTRMASESSSLIYNDDVKAKLQECLDDKNTSIIVMNCALCDFEGQVGDVPSGSHATRLESRDAPFNMTLTMADKIINMIKEQRPDIMVVGFKTTTNSDFDTMFKKSVRMGVDVVLANDTVTRKNILVCTEDNRHWYAVSDERDVLLKEIATMCEDKQGLVIKETNSEVWVDVQYSSYSGYMKQQKAFTLACMRAKLPESEFSQRGSHWSSSMEGVFILSKLRR
mgnify:CR=1 FL=1|tara:strand:- start:1016 stop:1816 length:801 start_codon:yes stop_codon:yes gene_type:complete